MRARLAAAAALALAASLGSGTPAFAAPPPNDTYAGRTVVGALPFTDQVDTTEATTDDDDAAIAAQCEGVPAFDASVWFEVTPSADGGLVADLSGSSYSAGAFVAVGAPGSWTLVACAPSTVGWEASAGVAYSVVAFDDQTDGGGNGGVLNITIDTIPPPPTIDLTVDPVGTFNARTGEATVSGTVVCSSDADFAFLEVQLSQTVGRFIIRGFGGTEVACDDQTRPWSLVIAGDNGTFAGGRALSVAIGVACGAFSCGQDFEERLIRLRRSRG